MAKFKYKFKSIKEIKERLEKKVQKELAIIDLDIKIKLDELSDLNIKLKECNKKKLREKSITIKDLHFYEKYQSFLNEQIELVFAYLVEKKKEREQKLVELTEKAKETKTFEKLEEKHLFEFVKVQDKIDQKEMDEFAVNEYLRD